MTRKQALAELIAKVEAGELGDYDGEALRLVRAWRSPLEYFEITRFVHTAYHGSLDAANALLDAVLTGWEWGVTCNKEQPDGPSAFVAEWGDYQNGFEATAETPARAWLLAILRALYSMEADT